MTPFVVRDFFPHQHVLPDYLGGWGLKNIYNFSKAMAAKTGWHLISTLSLCTEVVWHKYIAPTSLINWIHNPVRREGSISGILKEVTDSLDVIQLGLAWKIGNASRFCIYIDPWPRCNQSHILYNALVEFLDLNNY